MPLLPTRFNPPLSKTTRNWLQMVYRCSPLLAILALVVGSGFISSSSAADKAIHVTDGRTVYAGHCDSTVCSWRGIRFAAAPVGNLRFAPPQSPPSPPATQDATINGASCPQYGSNNGQNEDCLFLNIQRPRSVKLAVKIPVLVFVHGGGFETGSANDNDPSAMISLGASNSQPVVIVRINYRLGLFGFLAGTEIQSGRDSNSNAVGLNRGFQDIRMAMQWVQNHIYAFGGDPTKVTIWGQSAGSFGASAQLLAYPNNAPFQAAILESGSPGGVPIDPVSAKDAQYQRILTAANCQSSSNHLSCLRAVSWQTMNTISLQESGRAMQTGTVARGFYAWTGVIDGGPSRGGFFSANPSTVINSGAYAKVPILQGDCLDEGTYFVPHTFNNTADLTTWFKAVYFSNSNTSPSDTDAIINNVLQAYPDDPIVGSPYNPVGAAPTDRFYGPTNQYKRAASLYGDIRYQSNRRFWLSAFTQNNGKAYSYVYSQQKPGDAPSVGVPHGSDLGAILQSSSNAVSQTLARQYLAFATSLNPSSSSGLPAWPLYTSSNPTLLQYQSDRITQIRDDFRSSAMSLLNSPAVLKLTGR